MNLIWIKVVMTDDELKEFEELNNAILKSTTKMEKKYYIYELDKIIDKAKNRYLPEHWKKGYPVGSSYNFWLEDEDLYDDLIDED